MAFFTGNLGSFFQGPNEDSVYSNVTAGFIFSAGTGNDDITIANTVGNTAFGYFAGAGDDTIASGGGGDRMYGDAGDDVIIAGDGFDVMSGGSGTDTFQFDANDGADNWVTDLKASESDEIVFQGVSLVTVHSVFDQNGNLARYELETDGTTGVTVFDNTDIDVNDVVGSISGASVVIGSDIFL